MTTTRTIEIKFSKDHKGFVIMEGGNLLTVRGLVTFGLKENAVYMAKTEFPGATLAVFNRNGKRSK